MCREIPQACLFSLTILYTGGSVLLTFGGFSTFGAFSHMSAFKNYFNSSASKNRSVQAMQRMRTHFNSNSKSNSTVYVYGTFHTLSSTKCFTENKNNKEKHPPEYSFTEIHKNIYNLIYTCILWLKSHLQSISGSARVDRINVSQINKNVRDC